jgi:hypothetical protein
VKGQVLRQGEMGLVLGLLRMRPIILAAVREDEGMGETDDKADDRYC